MSNKSAVAACIAAAEQRVDAMQVLCEILTGQVKAERRQLEEAKAALDSPAPPGHGEPGCAAPGDTSLAMLES
jgi:hypothetical protein